MNLELCTVQCAWEICGNLTNGFFLLHTCKVSHVCRGVKTSPIDGKYLLDTSENSHFRSNLSEDLQQCTEHRSRSLKENIFHKE